ncbi:Vacuolar protein sorting-associated protein 37A [Nowakowskiella sp. JEL0407]|nr:Vacuolar protein sorting-associated protein 37A [Nowakowskiella sp. JEL0407]
MAQFKTSTSQEIRQSQINSLLHHGLAIRELRRNVEFEITVSNALSNDSNRGLSGTNLYIYVILPPNFPEMPPTITVKPIIGHAWVNSQTGQISGHDKLTRWNLHVNLGKLLKEISQEFQIRKPKLVENVYRPSIPPSYSANPLRAMVSSPPMPTSQHIPPITKTMTPDVNREGEEFTPPLPITVIQEFPGFEIKTLQELEVMLNDEVIFEEYFQNIPSIKATLNLRKELKAVNYAAAERNLKKEEEINELKKAVNEKLKEMKIHKELLDSQLVSYQNEIVRFSSEYIVGLLQSAAAESEELAQPLEASYKNKNMDLDDFLKQYRAVRKVYHLRAAKLEKISNDPSIVKK